MLIDKDLFNSAECCWIRGDRQ